CYTDMTFQRESELLDHFC
ncbi:hypothetical protein D049_5146B, partial [Vibrio parahaemolyticus VPTS-2010]